MTDFPGRLHFANIPNIRDVGQHINHLVGKPLLRTGQLFRSAAPDRATPNDQHNLHDTLSLQTILDLRTPTEHASQTHNPSAIFKPWLPSSQNPAPQFKYKHINLNGPGYSHALLKRLSYSSTAKLYFLYALGYRKPAIAILGREVMASRGLAGLARDTLTRSRKEVKQIFDVLSMETSFPVLVHCTQGKDRTGLVVLLVLLLCGVPKEAIERDYWTSQDELLREREEKLVEVRGMGLPDGFADCAQGWVEEVCGFVEQDLGGVEMYLEGCGVGVEQRRRVRGMMMLGDE